MSIKMAIRWTLSDSTLAVLLFTGVLMKKRIIFGLAPLLLALSLGLAGCDNPAAISGDNLIAAGNSEAKAAVKVTVEASAMLHCKGRAWPLVIPARGNERSSLQLEHISGTATWKLLNDVKCVLCGSNEWVSFNIRNANSSGSVELHFQHPAKAEEVPESIIITDRVNRK